MKTYRVLSQINFSQQLYHLSAGHQLIRRDQLSDLAAGTYYQQLITEEGVVVVPLVKI